MFRGWCGARAPRRDRSRTRSARRWNAVWFPQRSMMMKSITIFYYVNNQKIEYSVGSPGGAGSDGSCGCGLADPEDLECPRCGPLPFAASSWQQLSIDCRAFIWQDEAECPCCGWDTVPGATECPCCGCPQWPDAGREDDAGSKRSATPATSRRTGVRRPNVFPGSMAQPTSTPPQGLPAPNAPANSSSGRLGLILIVAVVAALVVWLLG